MFWVCSEKECAEHYAEIYPRWCVSYRSFASCHLFPIFLTFLCSVCGSSIAFYFVGYAFAFGGDPGKVSFIGSSNFLLLDAGSGDTKALIQIHWFFQFAFAATAGEYYV